MRISDWSSDVCSSDLLRTFKPQELATLLTKDATLRQALGFSRVPHRRTLERRLDATLPEAEAQVQALGQQILGEVEIGRAACRERVCQSVEISVVAGSLKKKKEKQKKTKQPKH